MGALRALNWVLGGDWELQTAAGICEVSDGRRLGAYLFGLSNGCFIDDWVLKWEPVSTILGAYWALMCLPGDASLITGLPHGRWEPA